MIKSSDLHTILFEKAMPNDGVYDGKAGFCDIEQFPVRRAGKFWMNHRSGKIYVWHDSRIDHSLIAPELDDVPVPADDEWDDATIHAMFKLKWVRGNIVQHDGTTIMFHGTAIPVRRSIKALEEHHAKMIDEYTVDIQQSSGSVVGFRFTKTEHADELEAFIRKGSMPLSFMRESEELIHTVCAGKIRTLDELI